MQQKKSINFGFRGWMLILYQFTAYIVFVAFTNWPMNALSEMYSPQNPQLVATLYTIAQVLGIGTQLVLSANINKVKNIKVLGIILGIVSLVFALGVMLIRPGTLWFVAYFLESFIVTVWCTFTIGILIGQWFPRRKGTVMGIVTFAFPIGNALLAPFATAVFSTMATLHRPNVAGAFLPYLIVGIVGLLIGAIFVKDYPEQCGAFRDNDRSFTPEMAKAMMEEEIENKKTTVWTLGHTLGTGSFWTLTLPMGFLLMTSIGMMSQTTTILGTFGFASDSAEFGMVMLGVCIIACIGSWLLGVLDTKLGTKRAIFIATIVMVISGIFGVIGAKTHALPPLLIALACLAVFMGASSNFTVSGAVQYWRHEDFPSVFARVNPVASLLSAFGPMIVATMLFGKGMPDVTGPFIFVAIAGVVSVILILLFKPSNVKKTDDKYRAAAGKPLDDVLVGRK
ncbi:MAG: MFS transporter [Oscillospiraceae bacterium]|nr:MFS transporter [Oscillospiraceae bacterium]